jgi:hypothetical protein
MEAKAIGKGHVAAAALQSGGKQKIFCVSPIWDAASLITQDFANSCTDFGGLLSFGRMSSKSP